jgi:DNA polymerase-1
MYERPATATVTTYRQLEAYLCSIKRNSPVGFDFEADVDTVRIPGKKSFVVPWKATVVGFSLFELGAEHAIYVPMRHMFGACIPEPDKALQTLYEFLLAQDGRRWAHSLGFELQMMRNHGLDGIDSSAEWDDSQVAAWAAGLTQDSRGTKLPQGLKFLASHVLRLPARLTFEDVAKGRQASRVPVEEMAEYAAWDASDTVMLGEHAYAKMERDGLGMQRHYRKIDMPCVEILRKCQETGIPVDTAALLELEPKLKREMLPRKCKEQVGTTKKGKPKFKTVERNIPTLRGADISKDREVSRWLFDELGWWPTDGLKRNKEGFYSVAKPVLDQMRVEGEGQTAMDMRLRYQEISKIRSTYIIPLCELPALYGDGRVHGRIKLTGTQTQRFSSSEPNLQNQPSRSKTGKAIRKALVAPPGFKIVVCDLSQAELRYAAHLSRDPNLMRAYRDDVDIHEITLSRLQAAWPEAQRTDAKVVNFSSMYNITDVNLAKKMHQPVAVAGAALATFWDTYAELNTLREWGYAFVREHGYMRTVDGFVRFLDNKLTRDRESGKRDLHYSVRNQVLNTAVQGSVGGHTKKSMILVDMDIRAAGLADDVLLAAQEHDSLVYFARDAHVDWTVKTVTRHMETCVKLRVKMKADTKTGQSWGDCK